MRKIAFLNIALIYLLLSVGVAKSTHYCMGRAINVEYFSVKAEGCSANDERKMPCCEDELEYLNIEDDHNSITFNKVFTNTYSFITPKYIQLEFNSWVNLSNESSYADLPDPPELYSKPIYITTHQFTFYG